jgi:hypothetical protein
MEERRFAMSEIVQSPPHLPRDAIRPAWRAAVLAYRANMRVTRHPSPAYEAALVAFREVLPEMPEERAKHEVMHAIAYAAANHTKWFWSGVYGASIEAGESPNRAGSDR